jgi:UDP-GlcNAc:undecaprenyl-phosphate GlcNAc-1-phosphate transferase
VVALVAAAWIRLGPGPALLACLSVGFAWIGAPWITSLAWRFGVVAQPGGRAVHRHATPLLGGAVVFLPVFFALLALTGRASPRSLGLLSAVSLMAVVGIFDDILGLRARWKLLLQALGAGLLVWGGFRLETLSLEPLGTFPLGWLEYPLVVLWVVGVTNAFNMVDGIDGLAAALALVAAVAGAAAGAHPLLAMALAGGCLGFLRHNLPRASLFLGDTGSLVLGMSVAALTLDLPPANNLPIALGMVAYPVGDVVVSVVRRMLRAKPPLTPDKSHVHHKIMGRLGSAVPTLVLLLGFAAAAAAVPQILPGIRGLLALGLLWVVLAYAVIRGCHVCVARMLAHRKHFRRIHAMRRCVLALVDAAATPEEVRRSICLLPQELDLAAVEFHGVKVARIPDREGRIARHLVVLREGQGAFEHVPWSDDPTLDTEVHAVVTEVFRNADRRIAALRDAEGRTGAPGKSVRSASRRASASRAGGDRPG